MKVFRLDQVPDLFLKNKRMISLNIFISMFLVSLWTTFHQLCQYTCILHSTDFISDDHRFDVLVHSNGYFITMLRFLYSSS